MPIINVNSNTETKQYNLVISRLDENGEGTTSTVVLSDNFNRSIGVINIEQGPIGPQGIQGETGPAGRDAVQFSILPISSGGTNNTIFDSGNIVFYDGTKITSSTYSIQDILDEASLSANAITGILSGSGIYKTETGNTVILHTSIGEGLEIDSNNQIAVDSTIARVAELDLGTIQGQVPISKGGTNNNFFNANKFVYYDGTQIKSFPLSTGNFLFSGISVNITAGSGLVGGGLLDIPNGTVSLNIPSSADILVTDSALSLSETGVAGTYSKVTTDSKGRVIEGTSLTVSDIITILGYTPYHPGNDGPGSNLDADLLDGQHGTYYRDASNLTGIIDISVLPSAVEPGTYTKVAVDSNGLVTNVLYANQSDIISSLGYTPVSTTGNKTIYGDTSLQGNIDIGGELEIYDHLPLLATDNPNILPDTPRGISFIYGGLFSNKTGILAYYPADNELKLVTNVFASGSDIDGDGDSDYQDDINGGNAQAIFVLQNLEGDASTILLRNIADSLYVKTSTNEDINGLKTFLDGIQVVQQIKITNPPGNNLPPLEIYGNTNKVVNLNADLLDGEDGTYYTEASNMTGAFSYENVTFDHIQGTHKYIPLFNDTQNVPANRITDSVIYQDNNNNIIISQNNSIAVSSGSDISSSQNSVSIGHNTISGNNALAVGSNNIVLSNNSVALNASSKAAAPNSVALGSYGRSYLPNQIAFGAFQSNDPETQELLQHAQHTTITAHLESTRAGNSWTSLTPTISIPQNTTIAYEAELLVSKTFGTGVAHYKFNSGLFKNATFRNANNLIEIINLTTQPQIAKKNELFNNSQIKNHYHSFRHPNSLDFQQDVHIRENIQTNTIQVENDKSHYEFTAIPKAVSGIYEKTNDGNLVLDINKPFYSGVFHCDTTSRGIKITSKNHGVTANSFVNLQFNNISSFDLENRYYKAYSIIDDQNFFVERPFYTGFLSYYSGTGTTDYAKIIFNKNSMSDISYTSGLLNISTKIYTYIPSEGSVIFSNGTPSSGYDYSDNLSLHVSDIEIPKRQTYPSGIEIEILPLAINSGSVFLHHKKNVSGDFSSNTTIFNKTKGVYTRKKTQDGSYKLEIYTSGAAPIDLPHTPLVYDLVSGYKDDDNDSFEIKNINDQFFLSAKTPFDYETKNIYNIRIKATDRSDNRFKEKNLTITVNDKRDPFRLYDIPDQVIDISDGFNYTIPSNLFNEEDNEGSLSYRSCLQNGKPLPSWLTFNNTTLNFSGTPSGCDLGIYNIRVYAANNFSEIFDDFYLTITDNSVQIFEAESEDSLEITDIQLSSTNIDENLPSGHIFAQISGIGSYRPYMEFITSQNNFTGILVNDQDFFEAKNIVFDFPLTSLSGDVGKIPKSGLLQNSSLPNDCRVVNVYKPFSLSGTPGLSDGKIHFVDSYYNNNLRFFSGLKVYTSEPLLLPNFTIQSFNDYSIFVGDRIALSTELDTEFPELIKTEDNDVLVTRYSNIRDTLLATENSENTEQEDETGYIIANDRLDTNVVWASGYPGCHDADLIENQLVSFTPRARDYQIEINTTGNLDNFNPPPQSGLKRSNINYRHDSWSFRDKIENPVLALYGIGSGDLCTLLSEDNNLINDENNNDIISNNENHHGTRININTTYELFENYRVVKDNGKLLVNKFDQFVAENGDPIVHDYAIAARSGDVCILFPGERQGNIDFYYDESSSSLLKENTNDLLYRDDGSLIIEHTLYDFYYNWGKLIQFPFINEKYYVKINSIYTGPNKSTLITHNNTSPTTAQYNISGLQRYEHIVQTGNCVYDIAITGIKGFEALDLENTEYATGIVDIYTTAGTTNIDLHFNTDTNLDNRDINHINLHTVSSSNEFLDLPIEKDYTDIIILDSNSIRIKNYFYLPASGIAGTGKFIANIDENHGYIEESSSIINRVPTVFRNSITVLSGINTSIVNRPKNYTFDVISIDGNKISVKDDKNYFLKENGRNDYFDQAIDAEYLTNGIKFSGSLFYNHSNIYDIRYNFYALDNIYDNITFEYDHSSKLFSFVIDSGVINPFDEVVVSFPTGFAYSSDPIADLITIDKILSRRYLHDLEPYKDNILLESSQSIDATDNTDQITITGQLSTGKDAQGTCTVNNNLTHRLQSGLLINHSGSPIFGHQIDSFVSGFNFNGVIPKNNNVISTDIDHLINNDHVGHASIFGTGNFALYSGARILRKALSNDIGFSEYYLINTNSVISTIIPPQYSWQLPQVSIKNLNPEDLGGVGSSSSPYRHALQSSGLNPANKKYVEFVYLGQNNNKLTIQGKYSVSGDLNRLNIYHTTFEEQTQRYRDSINREIPVFDTKVFTTGTRNLTDIVDYLDLSLDVKRFDKIKIELLPSSGNQYINLFDFSTFIVSGVNIKPYILESDEILNNTEDYYPYINREDPSLVYTPVPTLDINDCIDCNTNLPQYIPALDPEYSQFDRHKFYILPYIKTNNKYCGNNYEKNKQIFFNGNIIEISNFATKNSYLVKDDEIKILELNHQTLASSGVSNYIHKYNSSNETNLISGISIRGSRNIPAKSSLDFVYPILFQDQQRFDTPFGVAHNLPLHYTGIIKFIKSTSGQFDVLDYNNIYYHTYGGVTANYPADDKGRHVSYPQTGIYTIASSTDACTSGTLCITISGYNISAFTGISDFADRANIGKRTNVLTDANGVMGAVRPYGSERKFYFDFDDGAPHISNVYYIEDMLAANVLTIKTPYNSDYVGKSGIVYLIDSDQNIKSHLNPNIDNQLIISNGSLGNLPDVNITNFNYFDHSTKRWKHTVHIDKQPAHTGYSTNIATNKSVDFLSIGSEKIKIDNIKYSIDDSNTYENIENDTVTINSQTAEIIFKVRTVDGDNSLFDDRKKSTPKVSISGLGGYRIEMDEPINFGRGDGYWDIGIKCIPPAETGYNKNITIRASDLTGFDEKTININQYLQPDITPMYTGYAATGTNWFLGFDVSNLDIDTKLTANEIRLDFDESPENIYDLSYTDDRSIVYSGAAGTGTGLYHPTLSIIDLTTTPYQTINVATGSLMILDHISQKPAFDLQLNNFEFEYYLNIDHQDRILFEIPAELGPVPSEVLNNLNITFTTNPTYNMYLYSSSYNSNTRRFEIIAIPQQTGIASYVEDSAKYTNQTVGISLKQPVYDSFGNYTYQTYTKSFGFNITLYKDLLIDLIAAPENRDLFFDTDSAWSVDFYVLSGITEHDQFNRPNIRVFGAPNLSPYENNPSEYSVEYEYNTERKAWKVIVISEKDIFGDYVMETGIYPISIFAEDGYSSYEINNEINLIYFHTSKRRNIQPVVYGTPDNSFFTKADSFNLNESYTASEISLPSNLKEESINLNIIDKLYDRDLNTWEYGYISNPMIDKYDARLLLTNSSITLQCKGLGSDKIIAAAKINTIEIENNELQGLPLRITGINNYGMESGIVVPQGNNKWELTFKTIGGLAHENYPPTIMLSQMPTACSGFDPMIEEQMQCATTPTWKPDDLGGSWNYSFTGLPSCVLLGSFPFTITAIDTDTSLLPSNPYVASITESHLITYTETVFSGSPPNIVPDTENNQLILKPLCNNTLYRNKLFFGPAEGGFCLGPTGIKSFEISGSVPSGLSYTLFFPEEGNTPISPYSNIASGYLLIEGYPLTFASGTDYAEELLLTVTDARDLSKKELIKFTDSSTPLDPDVSIAIYFEHDRPVLTASTGLDILTGSQAKGWRPAPIAESLICRSILPHNGCKIIDVIYSGQLGADTRIFLYDLNTDDDLLIADSDEIYIDFLDATNDEIDGSYIVYAEAGGLPYIDAGITPQPATGLAKVVKGSYEDINLTNFDELFPDTNIIDNTTKCILGGGVVGRSLLPRATTTNRGLRGTVVPSFRASVTGLNAFETNNTRYSGLQFTRINPSVNIVSTVGWSDCWQTGYLNLSGIVVPPVSVEIVDPPPAQDYEFSFNGARFALGTRLSVGVTETQKLLPENERSATIKYLLSDYLNNTGIQSGNIAAGSSFDTVALSSNFGTIYKIDIVKDSDLFPSTNPNSLPGDENEYIWIHKANNLTTIPTQNSFPPVATFGFDSISVINDLDDSDPQGIVMDPVIGIALGGYVPSVAGIGEIEPYNITGSPALPWSTADYLPIISGIIQSGLNKNELNSIPTVYSAVNDLLTIQNTSFDVGDAIYYEFYTLDTQNIKTIQDSGSLILTASNIGENNYLTFTKDIYFANLQGFTDISFASFISGISNNQMIIRHTNIPFNTGDLISVDKDNISTELALLYNPGEISIVSGDSSLMYLENSNGSTDWHDDFTANDIVLLYKNLDDNIKIMPYNTDFITEGKYSFQITGRSNVFENIDLTYKICTAENSGMPIFNSAQYPSVNINPKKYFRNYPLHINKPITIIASTVAKDGDILSFSILGGKRPIHSNTPDIQLAAGTNDLGYCGFFRHSTQIYNIKDEYDSINDRLNIRITLSNDYGIDWSQHSSVKIKVSDETGSDEYVFNY